MAKDIYGGRKMYVGPWFFILIIPIGLIIICFLYDFGRGNAERAKLDLDTKEILTEVLNREGLETLDEMHDFAERQYKLKGYDPEDLTFTEEDNGQYIIATYNQYTSVIGELSFGLVRSKRISVHSAYKGYFNEFKEIVIEKYVEDDTEDLLVD